MQHHNKAKVRATIYLPQDVLDEARDAAVHLAGYPARLTLTQLAENAFRAELRRLKALYNNGQDFPPRDGLGLCFTCHLSDALALVVDKSCSTQKSC